MALALALPLFGLDPQHFSTLSMKLLDIETEYLRNLSDSGRASPSTASESSGISSLAMSGESVELTPVSSRPETPTKVPWKNQEKANVPVRLVYGGRDVLNLAANIRPSFDWQIRDQTSRRHDFHNFTYVASRSKYYRLHEQPLTKDYPMKRCTECGFCEPISVL